MFTSAWAHAPPQQGLEKIVWSDWNGSTLVLLSLFLSCAIYARGWAKMRLRQKDRISRVSGWHAISFYLGIAMVFIALVSAIDPLSDMLAWVHMIQHTLLMTVAAPLIALGSPGYIALWALPVKRRFAWFIRALRFSRPIVAGISYAMILWLWHLPVLYEAALFDSFVHDLQHLAFFVSAFLFWRVLLEPYIGERLHPGVGIVYLFVSSLHPMILGVLMALSPIPWYRLYETRASLYGFTALQDQQIAGYIMWMPAGFAYVAVAAHLVLRLLREASKA